MFKIYFVNSAYEKKQVLMYDDTRYDDELKLGNPKLHIEVNAAGTLDFELPPTNVAYSKIIPMVTEFHVIKDNQKTHDKHIWFGRVLTIDTDLYGTKTIHCEGGLAYLNDCIYYDKTVDMGSWNPSRTVGRALFARYESPIPNESGVHVYGVSPQEASAVIANIMSGGLNYEENLNAPFKHLGRIAKDTDSDIPVYAWVNEPVVPSGDQADDYYFVEDNLDSAAQKQCGISNPNNMTAIDLISSMMNNVGGLFWVSKTPHYPKRTFGGADLGDAVYVMQLHMRRHYPTFNPDEGQTIQFGENLTDLTITDDGTTFFTAVHPHGQRANSGEDFTLGGRGIQNGTTAINKRTWQIDPAHGVMYCPELVKEYGMIIRDLDVGTTNIYEQLIGMGISEIDSIPIISKTVGGDWASGVREMTVKGIDLSLYNVDYSSIELTDAVRVLVPKHGIDTYLNVTAIDYDLQNVENTVFTLNAIKSSNEITNASPSYGSSSVSSYVHPKHTEHDIGFYKFSNDSLGHVDAAVAVNKKDITALGIPGEDTNTTYELSKDGNTIKMTGSDGSSSEVEVDSSLNTTYTLTKNGNEITLTGSDGTTYTVVDSDTVYTHPKFTEYANGLYTVTVNNEGHITNAQAVTKTDITGLGIPSTDDMPFVWWKTSSTRDIYVYLKDYQGPHHHDTKTVFFNKRKEQECSYSDCLVFNEPSFTNGAENTYVLNSIIADPLCEVSIQSGEPQKHFAYGIVFGLENRLHLESTTVGSNPSILCCLIAGSQNDIYYCSDSCVVGSFNICKSIDAFIGGRWCVGYEDALIELGNGYKDHRSDAFYVTKKGDVYCYGDDTSLNAQIDENTAARHTHSNKSVLDATTASYTTAEKTKLSGIEAGAKKNVQSDWNATSGDAYIKNKPAMIVNSALWVSGADSTAKWVKLGTLVSSGNFSNGVIRVWTGDGANGRANQNSSFEVQIKDGWQSTPSAVKACGVTVYRINCSSVKVKVIPTAHDTYTVWVYMPWGYWNGNYAVYGKYKSWTSQHLIQSDEPEGTGADIAYYDQAFLTSKVATAAEAATLTDSGWVNCPLAVTGNTTYPTSASTIRVRKYGKMVKLEGWVRYAKVFNNGHNVAIIPDGYRPANAMHIIGVTNSGAGTEIEFYVTIGAYGNIGFSPADQKSSATFNPAVTYEFYATYFID